MRGGDCLIVLAIMAAMPVWAYYQRPDRPPLIALQPAPQIPQSEIDKLKELLTANILAEMRREQAARPPQPAPQTTERVIERIIERQAPPPNPSNYAVMMSPFWPQQRQQVFIAGAATGITWGGPITGFR